MSYWLHINLIICVTVCNFQVLFTQSTGATISVKETVSNQHDPNDNQNLQNRKEWYKKIQPQWCTRFTRTHFAESYDNKNWSYLRASYLRFSGRCAAAVGATLSSIPLLLVTAATLPGRPATPGTNDAGPLLVNSTRPGGSIMPDVGGRTNMRRASDVTKKRCWASTACRCCNVRPAKFGIIGRPGTAYNQHNTRTKNSLHRHI